MENHGIGLISLQRFQTELDITPSKAKQWIESGWLDAPVDVDGLQYLTAGMIYRFRERALRGEFIGAPKEVAKKKESTPVPHQQPEQIPTPANTDTNRFLTPTEVAARWRWHPESVRRAVREGRVKAILISRRLLIPVAEIERIEAEGKISRNC